MFLNAASIRLGNSLAEQGTNDYVNQCWSSLLRAKSITLTFVDPVQAN